ncbi:MAG: endonuclease/exonuclease/phosphatase family protein [Planctomycetota bacterium]
MKKFRTWAAVVLWGVLVAVVGAVALANVSPDDLAGESAWRAWQFRLLVAQFHVACCVLVGGVVALALRRWWLAATAGVVAIVMGALVQVGPSAATPSGPTLRVVSANVYFLNPRAERAAADLANLDADLLLLQEWNPLHIEPFAAAFGESHPYRLSHPARDPNGFAIYSKVPFRLEPTDESGLEQKVRRVRLQVNFDEQDWIVYNVHPSSPGSTAGVHANRIQSKALAEMIAGETLPTVVAGDFNHTPNTWNADAIRASGVTGRGSAGTWPFNRGLRRIFWPKFRIDDVLVSEDLGVWPLGTFNVAGADHHAVLAEVGRAE